jgi:hypothetical protein
MLFTCDFLESTFTHFSSLNERHTTFLFILCNVITLIIFFFYVLLTVHLSIFILLINQLDAQNLFYNKFISCLYVLIVRRSKLYYTVSGTITPIGGRTVHGTATYRCDGTRNCIIQV